MKKLNALLLLALVTVGALATVVAVARADNKNAPQSAGNSSPYARDGGGW